MGKAHNRNKNKIKNGKQVDVMSGGKGKGFIGSNVFTMDDEAIIDKILQDPKWSINDIKRALPYSHSIKNIINFLQTKISPEEINAHSTRVDTTPDTPATPVKTKPAEITRSRWTKADTEIVKTYYPVLGQHDNRWQELLPHRTKTAIKQHAINNKTLYLTRDNLHAFTKDDDDLLLAGYQELGYDPYEWVTLLTHPHTMNDIKTHVEYLLKQQKANTPVATPTPKPVVDKPKPVIDKPKPVIDKPKPQKEPIMKEDTISNEQLFEKLRELAKTEGITVSVNIDFGDGLMFVLNDKGDK